MLKSLKAVGSLRQPAQIANFNSFFILALKRYLYVLGTPVSAPAGAAKSPVCILNKFEFDGSVKFEIFEGIEKFEHQDMIAIMHEQDKLVNFYDLLQFLELPVAPPKSADAEAKKDGAAEAQPMLPQLKPLYSL